MSETGAVDLDSCPSRNSYGRCKCGICAICGHRKHMAVHGPSLGEKPGSKPWGHEYKAMKRTPKAEYSYCASASQVRAIAEMIRKLKRPA